jgi:hypothetical protein
MRRATNKFQSKALPKSGAYLFYFFSPARAAHRRAIIAEALAAAGREKPVVDKRGPASRSRRTSSSDCSKPFIAKVVALVREMSVIFILAYVT